MYTVQAALPVLVLMVLRISLVLAQIATLEKIERYTGREVERRAIKNLCAEFPVNPGVEHQSEKKRSRAAVGGGFDKRRKDEEKRHKPKQRLRDRKNKGALLTLLPNVPVRPL